MSNADPVELVLERMRTLGKKTKRAGPGWSGRCPAHDDKRSSLSIKRGSDNRALLYCHTGCSFDDVCAALGLTAADLSTAGNGQRKHNSDWDVIARYPYLDDTGNLIAEHVRYRNKIFHWREPVSNGGFRYGLYAGWFEQWDDGDWRSVKDKDKNLCDDPDKKPHANARWFDASTRRVLYQEARIREAQPGALALYVEGEKDVQTATRLDFLATTAGSASDWRPQFAEHFAQLNLVIIPDNDQAGERLAAKVAADCYGVADTVCVLRLPNLEEHGDLSDWEVAGGNRDALLALIADVPLWHPEIASDDLTGDALQQAKRVVDGTAFDMIGDGDVPLSADVRTDEKLRFKGREAARVIDTIMLILAGLGFEGNHYRLINALIAHAKKLPNPFVYFIATHAQIYQKYRRGKEIKDKSKTALVGADTAKLRAEQDALGVTVLNYQPGSMNLESGQGYGSRYRLQILRYALIAIDLADKVKGEFNHRWQADEWAAQQVAEMIPRGESSATVKGVSSKAEKRADISDFEAAKKAFLKAADAEFNRIVDRHLAKHSGPVEMGEAVDELSSELVARINRMASEALCRGLAETVQRAEEEHEFHGQLYPHESMEIDAAGNDWIEADSHDSYMVENINFATAESLSNAGDLHVHESMDICDAPEATQKALAADAVRPLLVMVSNADSGDSEESFNSSSRTLITSMPSEGQFNRPEDNSDPPLDDAAMEAF